MPKYILALTLLLTGLLSSGYGQSAKPTPTKPLPTAIIAPSVRVGGEVAHPLTLTAADLAKLPRQTLTAKDHDGNPVTFEGVAVGEILRAAGVELGKNLRGKNLTLFLVVEAADNYRAVFALPELDPAFTDQVILLADRQDGKPLSAAEGPWRIVVPNEKRPARWVRQVVALTIRRA